MGLWLHGVHPAVEEVNTQSGIMAADSATGWRTARGSVQPAGAALWSVFRRSDLVMIQLAIQRGFGADTSWDRLQRSSDHLLGHPYLG